MSQFKHELLVIKLFRDFEPFNDWSRWVIYLTSDAVTDCISDFSVNSPASDQVYAHL